MAFIIMNEIIQRSTPQAIVSRIIITASVNTNGLQQFKVILYALVCKKHSKILLAL